MSKHNHQFYHRAGSSHGGNIHTTAHHHHHIEPSCEHQATDPLTPLTHSLDLVTTLRSELAASSYKKDRLMNELTEAKSALCAKENECESLRAQTARQSALIGSLQTRLQTSETRERNCDSSVQTLQREKRSAEDRNKDLMAKLRRLEVDMANEENHKEQVKGQLNELLRKMCVCLSIDVCDPSHLTPDYIVISAGEVMTELHRLRTKLSATCETLNSCESQLLNLKSIASSDKQRMTAQIETTQAHQSDLEARCRQLERDLQIARERLTESDLCNEKLREELRGFESRCHRLQTAIDRFQSDRLQFLRGLASIVSAAEPCETLVKDKVREILNENQAMHNQLHNLREQLTVEANRHRETLETTNCRLRAEESQKCTMEERLEKTQTELQELKGEHMTLSEYLVRLARALCWGNCTSPPDHGSDTTILAESLLERAERISTSHHHDHHAHSCDKNCSDDHHHHHHNSTKLRRERSCHEIPLKESSALYSLQRRIRVLREQVQRRDLHVELLRRKLALLEDEKKCKSILIAERDEALSRARRTMKQLEKTSQQLMEAKSQLGEIKTQLAEAAEFKITALERSRKIDELNARICDLETEKVRLQNQIISIKDRARSAAESSQERRCRDETLIHSLREEIARLKTQLTNTNIRLSNLQTFRTSVARTLHLREIPETDLLHRLQILCSAHNEITMGSRRFEAASSPVPIAGEHPCPSYDDLCGTLSSSPRPVGHHHRRYDDDETHFNEQHHHQHHNNHNFDVEFDYKKY